MKIKELRPILESLDKDTANWAYGYLKGYFNIKEDNKDIILLRNIPKEIEKQKDKDYTYCCPGCGDYILVSEMDKHICKG